MNEDRIEMNVEFRWREVTKDEPPSLAHMWNVFEGVMVLQARYPEQILESNGPFDPSVVGMKMGEWRDINIEHPDLIGGSDGR